MGKLMWNEATIERFEREGRGKGTGSTYIPWIKTTDFHSEGTSRRLWCFITGRHHELLSDIEFYLFLWLDFLENVVDIREGYPLDRKLTLRVAQELRIRHPHYPTTHVPTVMTVDFLVTAEIKGAQKLIAFSTKDDSAVNNENELSKLEILRETLARTGVEHHLILRSAIPTVPTKNMIWIRDAALKSLEEEPWDGAFDELAARMLLEMQTTNRAIPLNAYCTTFDQTNNLMHGTGLRVARLLMHKKRLLPPMYKPDLHLTPIADFTIANPNK
jgi:hypothetical protein